MKNFYITTTLPYVNAEAHIGFAREIIQADVMARFQRVMLGAEKVFFNTGTDEHGQKIFQKAQEKGLEPQLYCDQLAEKFQGLKKLLDLSYDRFIRTTDVDHVAAAQEFWKICDQNGYIYKKQYKVKYCVGCELEKTDSDLVDGCCPLHPNQKLELIEEENYFFKFSAFGQKLTDLYEKNPRLVVPEYRFREIKKFVEMGLEDFSISRLKSKMPWGVPVPGDPDQVIYVWFDALVNYISTLGWPQEKDRFEKFWPGFQLCGKDNLRQQSAMWQAMLMAAGIANTQSIYINGFINSGGQKMSKSLGNVITPVEMVQRYGTDATRYLLLSIGSFGEDADITWAKMDEKYNSDLANGLGNLTSRVVKLFQKMEISINDVLTEKGKVANDSMIKEKIADFEPAFREGRLELALNSSIMSQVKLFDKLMEEKKPWQLVKENPQEFEAVMKDLVFGLQDITDKLGIYLPQTAAKIRQALETKQTEGIFQRIR